MTVVVALGAGCPAAYAMARFRMLSHPGFTSLVLLAYMFPPILLGIPLFVLFAKAGLSDSYLGLYPRACDLLAAVRDVDDARLLSRRTGRDRGSRVRRRMRAQRPLWSVVLPIARPGLVAAGIFCFILSWSDYIYGLILMKSETRKTISVGLSLFIDSTTIEPGLMMAGAVLITVPALVCFMFVQRFLVQGLAMGAVK